MPALASVGLRARLAAVALLAVAPFAAVIAWLELDRRGAVERDYAIEAGRMAEHAAGQTAGLTAAIGDTLRTISTFPSIRDANFDHCRRVLAGILREHARFTALVAADADGKVLCSAPVPAQPVEFLQFDWFKVALAAEGLRVGAVITGPISGLPTLPVSYAFRIPQRPDRIVVFAGVDLRWIATYLASVPLPAGGKLIAYDHGGALIAPEPAARPSIGPLVERLRPIAMQPPAAPRVMRFHDGKRWAVATSRVGSLENGGMELAVALDLDSAAALRRAPLWWLGLALAGVMAVSAVAVTLAARQLVVRPLRRVTRTAEAVAAGNLGARVGAPYPGGELGGFMRAFDDMAEKLRRQIRRVTEEKRERAGLYRRLNDAVYRLEPNGNLNVTFISDRVRDLFDVAPEALLGPREAWKGIDFVAPPQEMVNAMLRQAVARQRPIDLIYRVRTALGNERWVWERAEPLLDLSGEYQGYEGVLTDITDRKRVEQDMISRHRDLTLHYGQLLDAIAALAEARDPYTAGHQRRVASLAVAIARELDLPAHRIDGLALAARIHDVGKIGVPADILVKPSRLTDTEYAMVKEHVRTGYDVLKGIEFPWPIAQMVLQHHERLDGSGYPNGIKGEQMLAESKIMAVADVVESMASHRPYRPARGLAEVRAELERGRGTIYDADAVDAALRFLAEGNLHFEDDAEALLPTAPPLDFGEARARRERSAALLKPEP